MTPEIGQLRRPKIFGIVNITPDSFSDGGDSFSLDDVLARVDGLLEEGADTVDIGAESTRPGAREVLEHEEWQRLELPLNRLKERGLLGFVSVDTRKYSIMRRAAEMGCQWINCVGPLPSEAELKSLKTVNSSLGFVGTHIHGDPKSMHLNPLGPQKVVSRVEQFFQSSKLELEDAGFRADEQLFDPGLGFGKNDSANLAVMAHCQAWAKDYPVAIGISRKSIFSRLFGILDPKSRDEVSKVAELGLALCGVRMIRTHNVKLLLKCLNGAGLVSP